MAQMPTLASLIAAVRAALPSCADPATRPDADIAEAVRTARTTKGAVWLATRAFGAGEDDSKAEGREQTALACLEKLAAAGHPCALAALTAWSAEADAQTAALAAALDADRLAGGETVPAEQAA